MINAKLGGGVMEMFPWICIFSLINSVLVHNYIGNLIMVGEQLDSNLC